MRRGNLAAFVEAHSNIAAQDSLHVHRPFGRHFEERAVYVRTANYLFVADFLEACEREDLKASGIRKNWTLPVHEGMKSASLSNNLRSGT